MKFDAAYMRAAARRPGIHAAKERSYELMELRPGSVVADLGCGPGVDTLALAARVGETGRVMGIDSDPEMVLQADAAAREAGMAARVEHRFGSVTALPFADAEFDACRCERVLQHLSREEGMRTVAEALRVLRPGGVLVLLDTDWPSLSIHSPDPVFERWIARVLTDGWRNGYAARGIPELLTVCGVRPEGTETRTLRLALSEVDVLLSPTARHLADWGFITFHQWEAWLSDLARAEAAGTFFATLNLVLSHGRKP